MSRRALLREMACLKEASDKRFLELHKGSCHTGQELTVMPEACCHREEADEAVPGEQIHRARDLDRLVLGLRGVRIAEGSCQCLQSNLKSKEICPPSLTPRPGEGESGIESDVTFRPESPTPVMTAYMSFRPLCSASGHPGAGCE